MSKDNEKRFGFARWDPVQIIKAGEDNKRTGMVQSINDTGLMWILLDPCTEQRAEEKQFWVSEVQKLAS